jgi:hypothetical protein
MQRQVKDRTVTQAHIVVLSEELSEDALQLELAERLKGLEIEKLEIERVQMVYLDAA